MSGSNGSEILLEATKQAPYPENNKAERATTIRSQKKTKNDKNFLHRNIPTDLEPL